MQTIDDLLIWLTTSGGAIALVSFALSFSTKFTLLKESTQKIIRIVFMLLVIVASKVGIDYLPVNFKETVSPYVGLIGAALGGLFITEKASKKGDEVNTSRGLKRDAKTPP